MSLKLALVAAVAYAWDGSWCPALWKHGGRKCGNLLNPPVNTDVTEAQCKEMCAANSRCHYAVTGPNWCQNCWWRALPAIPFTHDAPQELMHIKKWKQVAQFGCPPVPPTPSPTTAPTAGPTTAPTPAPTVPEYNPVDKSTRWCVEGNHDDFSEGDSPNLVLHDAPAHGWRWCGVTVDECKALSAEIDGVIGFYRTQNGCCFPFKRPCAGPHCPGHCRDPTDASGTYRMITGAAPAGPVYSRDQTDSTFPITVGTTGSLGMEGSSFTAAAWVYLTEQHSDEQGDHAIFGGAGPHHSENRALHLQVRNGRYYMGFYRNDCSGGLSVLNEWQHAVFVYDFPARKQMIYVNGVLVNTCEDKAPLEGDDTVLLGSWSNGRLWEGQIKGAKIYDYAVTPDAVADMYSLGSGAHAPEFTIQPKTGCTGQSTQVADAVQCQTAAEMLGKRYWGGNGHSSGADPKGCIFRTPDNDIYFNTHPNGSLNRGDRKLVCQE